jgi:PAS domain S-box-containing protein
MKETEFSGSEVQVREGEDYSPHPTILRVPHRSETEERIAADERARRKGHPTDRGRVARNPYNPRLINPAVAALCEAVRDYAIFVMDPHGVIVYWGMGAHLMKWWTKAEAEGAHLRMLYPEGGAEDGTAEDHLAAAAARGECTSEGQRVRRGGSTFGARITLTALYDQGELIGFAKVTQDLTQVRAREAAVARANEAQSTREAALEIARQAEAARQQAEDARQQAEQARARAEAARERAEEAAAFARDQARNAQEHITQVLQPALAAEQAQRASLGVELDAYVELFKHRERENKGI